MDDTEVGREAEGTSMLVLAAGLWVVVVCIVLALGLAVIDEFTRPPANIRRAGALLALVGSFASLWLLLRPPQQPPGCPAPVMILAEPTTPAGCPPGWPNTIGGFAAAFVAVGAVVATRHRS